MIDITRGKFMVIAIVKTLIRLDKDADLVEFLHLVQHECISMCISINDVNCRQTPQIEIFPHKKITFHKR
jgi:hypothetical protein